MRDVDGAETRLGASGAGGSSGAQLSTGKKGVAGSTARRTVVARHRALPSGRAALGALLVTAAAAGAFVIATQNTTRPIRSIVVAANNIAVGEVIDQADLRVIQLDLPDVLVGHGFALAADVEGMTATAPLKEGDPILRSAVITKLAAGTQEISFPIETGRGAGGLVGPNDHVNLFVSWELDGSVVTELLLADALVLRVNRSKDEIDRNSGYELVVAVERPEESTRLAHAIDQGRITVVRTTDDRDESATPQPLFPSPRPSSNGTAS